MSFWEQLKAITWKNYTISKRHWFLTLMEIAAPIMFYLFEPLFFNKMYFQKPVLETHHHQETVGSLMQSFNKKTVILYTPSIEYVNDVMSKVIIALNLNKRNIIGFKTEEKLMETLETNLIIHKNLATINFKVYSNTKIEYCIVFYNYNNIWQSKHLHRSYSISYHYMFHNFLPLQIAVGTTCLNAFINDSVTVVMQKFPSPKITSELPGWYATIYATLTAISYSILCVNVLHHIVEEKSSGMKEIMKAMGMHPLLTWIEWYLHTFMISIISILGCTILVKITLWTETTAAIRYSSSTEFFLFLFAYILASVSFCFAISSFFCNPLLADTVGLLIWMLSYVYPPILMNKPVVKEKLIVWLFPNAVLYSGFTIIQLLEERNIGIQWDNIHEYPTGNVNDCTMSSVFTMLIFDSILYLLITLYLEIVCPGPYGISKPFYFPLKNFYHSFFAWHNNVDSERHESITHKIQQIFKLPIGISINNLCKDYENINAVNNVSFKIYKGQITGLLGHHGSGKSTIISILAGMAGASRGKVAILGHDVEFDLCQIRRSLGVCLQEDRLFTELSVIEHLTFFGIIKGLSKKSAYKEACSLLRRFKLTNKKPSLVSQLSNGMKRKLSICIAIIGNPKVLLLDEPTVGLDEESSRVVWNMLLSLRHSRIIVFSTQSMEEADILADQIAIFNQGNLVCYGTPSYLRTEYDAKYYLAITFNKVESSKTNYKKTIKIVSDRIPRASLYSTGEMLTFSLPSDAQLGLLTLLETLENCKVELQIIKMKLFVSTIEEIYIKVSQIPLKTESLFLVTDNEERNVLNTFAEKLTGYEKTFSQFIILFKKRFWIEKRNWSMNLFEIFFMVVLTTLTLYTFNEYNSYSNDNTETKTNKNPRLYYSASNETMKFANTYKNLAQEYTEDIQMVPNVHAAIIKEGSENLEFYKNHLIVASEFNKSNNGSIIINALYSYDSLESAPISFSLAINAALKTFQSDAFIVCTGIPTERRSRGAPTIINNRWYFIFTFGLLCYSGKFSVLSTNEKIINVKHLQLSSGVHFSLYWAVSFIWDLIFFVALIGVIFVVILVYEKYHDCTFYGTNELAALFSILISYACSTISYSYAYCCVCIGTKNFLTFMSINVFLGFSLTHVVICCSRKIVETSIFHKLLQLLPQYALATCIYQLDINLYLKYLYFNNATVTINKTRNIEWSQNYYYGQYGILPTVLIMFFSTFLYLAILTALETKLKGNWCKKISRLLHSKNFEELNRNQVQQKLTNPTTDIFVSQNISKSKKHKYINKSIHFGVKPKECLGILGPNGSGKTTFFRVVTGECLPTTGDAQISYENELIYLSSNLKKYCSMLGYCPQSNGLMNNLTGREMLYLFGKIRGIAGGIDNLVSLWMYMLDLEVFSNTLCKDYSKGDKRKLSIGIALIGSPSVVFLDEPVAGVDLETYTNVSNILNFALKQHNNICIILSTQNPSICESMCNQIGVLENGQLKYCNNITYFQNKYGKGFTVKLKLNISKKQFLSDIESSEIFDDFIATVSIVYKRACHKKVANLMNDVQFMYNELCLLKDRNDNLLHYHIQDETKKWSEVYKEIADLQCRHSIIENYEISDLSSDYYY